MKRAKEESEIKIERTPPAFPDVREGVRGRPAPGCDVGEGVRTVGRTARGGELLA
jgi:hypothetical protein